MYWMLNKRVIRIKNFSLYKDNVLISFFITCSDYLVSYLIYVKKGKGKKKIYNILYII